MAWAQLKTFAVEKLASAAKTTEGDGGLQCIMQNKKLPDVLNVMQVHTIDVIGTDGHRQLCKRERSVCMCLLGAPLVFVMPHLADFDCTNKINSFGWTI